MPEELGPGLAVEMESRPGVLHITIYGFETAVVNDEGDVNIAYREDAVTETFIKITPPVQLPTCPFIADTSAEVVERLTVYLSSFDNFEIPNQAIDAAVDSVARKLRAQELARRRHWLMQAASWN